MMINTNYIEINGNYIRIKTLDDYKKFKNSKEYKFLLNHVNKIFQKYGDNLDKVSRELIEYAKNTFEEAKIQHNNRSFEYIYIVFLLDVFNEIQKVNIISILNRNDIDNNEKSQLILEVIENKGYIRDIILNFQTTKIIDSSKVNNINKAYNELVKNIVLSCM